VQVRGTGVTVAARQEPAETGADGTGMARRPVSWNALLPGGLVDLDCRVRPGLGDYLTRGKR
jgi:hypothetical protein